MSTQHLPAFLPKPIQAIGLESLVLLLCALTLLFYFIQIAATKVAEKNSIKGAHELLDSANKVLLFDNQEELARNAYQHFTGLLSCLLFSLISLSILFWFYPEIAVIILTCAIFMLNLHALMCRSQLTINQLNHTQLAFKINSSVGASFFIVFIFIVVDFLYLSPPNFLVALGSFIISRQIISNMGTMVRHTFALTKNHDKITALFFHHHVLEPNGSDFDSPLWQLIDENQYEWIIALLKTHLDIDIEQASIVWLDTGLRNVGLFEVDLNHRERHLLVKVFDKAALLQATHEESLLKDLSARNLISPPLFIADSIATVKCHIYDLKEVTVSNLSDQWASEQDILKELLMFSPSGELTKQYLRSKQTLPDRFGIEQLKHLKLVSQQKELDSIEQFVNQLDQLLSILRSLPLWFINPQLSQFVAIRKDFRLKIIHWGKWELEPMGAVWPINHEKLKLIEAAIDQASVNRPELKSFPVDYYKLAALTYALERSLLGLRFNKSLSLIDKINKILDKQKLITTVSV